jgi:hypothetical protein
VFSQYGYIAHNTFGTGKRIKELIAEKEAEKAGKKGKKNKIKVKNPLVD